MNRKSYLLAAIIAGIVSIYSCGNRENNRDNQYQDDPILTDTMNRDRDMRVDTLIGDTTDNLRTVPVYP